MKAIIVTGSREWTDGIAIHDRLRTYPDFGTVLIHGGARGADTLADCVGRSIGWPVIPMPAQWEDYGNHAGSERNREMLMVLLALGRCGYEIGVDAFPLPQSRGTWHMVRIAREAGVPVWVWGEEAKG